QSKLTETLFYRDSEIEALKDNLDDISSERDVYHEDAHYQFLEAETRLRENAA
ncbi:hypothetical protein HAX54_012407, partial [Datura stramonium]|nr:hypothetical protein [Datura stramonium]